MEHKKKQATIASTEKSGLAASLRELLAMSGLKFLIAAPVMIAFAFYLVFHFIIAPGVCTNKIYEEQSSPNKMFRAVLFSRDCKAAAGRSMHLSILRHDETLGNTTSGNVFVCDGDTGSTVDSVPVKMEWITDDSIHITYHRNAHPSTTHKRVGKIAVGYAEASPDVDFNKIR